MNYLGPLLLVSQRCKELMAAFSSGGETGDESTSKLIAIPGKLYFLAVV